jgi:hypothetical protein
MKRKEFKLFGTRSICDHGVRRRVDLYAIGAFTRSFDGCISSNSRHSHHGCVFQDRYEPDLGQRHIPTTQTPRTRCRTAGSWRSCCCRSAIADKRTFCIASSRTRSIWPMPTFTCSVSTPRFAHVGPLAPRQTSLTFSQPRFRANTTVHRRACPSGLYRDVSCSPGTSPRGRHHASYFPPWHVRYR